MIKRTDLFRRGERPVIAFYAPLKSPQHPVPSGDRKIARLLVEGLKQANFDVVIASHLRTFDKKGSMVRQQRMVKLAERVAERIIKRWQRANIQPDLWFSYHLYYKAPDIIGPIICRKLNIPYVVVEASWAMKRARGAWSLYHQYVDEALGQADKILCINPVDRLALVEYFKADKKKSDVTVLFNAFIDHTEIADFKIQQDSSAELQVWKAQFNRWIPPHNTKIQKVSSHQDIDRAWVADFFSLNPRQPWLISVAMMRSGDKHESYKLLAKTVEQLNGRYQLLIVGTGEKQAEVQALFAGNSHVVFAGILENDLIRKILSHFEIIIWPAIKEALGMVFLEAQMAGVAVVAGDQGGVSSIVADGVTGKLVDPYNTGYMATVIDQLLQQPAELAEMQQAAVEYVQKHHSLKAAAISLQHHILPIIEKSR